jgi:hypothetical protein
MGLRRLGRIAGIVAAVRNGWYGDSARGRRLHGYLGGNVTKVHRFVSYAGPRDARGRFRQR